MVTDKAGVADLYAHWARLESLPAAAARQHEAEELALRRAAAELNAERQRRLDTVRQAQDSLRRGLRRALDTAAQRGIQPGRRAAARGGAPDFAAVDRLCQELDSLRALRADLNAQGEGAHATLRQIEDELSRQLERSEALARARARDRVVLLAVGACAVVGFVLGSSLLGLFVVLGGAALAAHHLYGGMSAVVVRPTPAGSGPGLSDGVRGAVALLGAGAFSVVALILTAASPESCDALGRCGPAVLPTAQLRELPILAFSRSGSAIWLMTLLGAIAACGYGARHLAGVRAHSLRGK
ncbi:hypothetical protein [Modestobacter sp. VKM Ac-2984]|uniref:hypothetical protein n=1 Tax=Modestobacter sp. VKM Ac-2984 TaxID=3004138 RepID=UPI0022AAE9B1|nr:hypothetical protein [Modestobacter sp. VKM Ac-2984]MCZ2817275.1 hypothetical protein [Modestobacter sp. VKM Ac-2984]